MGYQSQKRHNCLFNANFGVKREVKIENKMTLPDFE